MGDIDSGSGWVSLRRDGGLASLWTGPRAVGYLRRQIQAVALALMVGGLLLLRYSIWGWLAVAAAPVVWLWLPDRWAVAKPLLQVDRRMGALSSASLTEQGLAFISVARLEAVIGAWETFGWSSRSAIYAVEGSGTRHLLLTLGGTNDRFAMAVCEALGALLGLPASYLGPEGEELASYSPSKEAIGAG